ncbi:MAG: DUF3015 domain-containing protein [Deferribacteraceae bacterium]|jgi:hypothetical protein|nr:DUF3015 domain-containing protein [Deferribacteraceae bacterium]
MKKILVLLGILVFCGVASASQMNTGCGLGTMLLGDKKDTKLMQILITCTNGTTTNQSIGITLDIDAFKCKKTSSWASNKTVEEFVQANMDSIVRDVAQGEGDTITSIAQILEIEDVDTFAHKLQDNFALIFPSKDVEFAYVAEAIVVISHS